jgi:hypothetical protein
MRLQMLAHERRKYRRPPEADGDGGTRQNADAWNKPSAGSWLWPRADTRARVGSWPWPRADSRARVGGPSSARS